MLGPCRSIDRGLMSIIVSLLIFIRSVIHQSGTENYTAVVKAKPSQAKVAVLESSSCKRRTFYHRLSHREGLRGNDEVCLEGHGRLSFSVKFGLLRTGISSYLRIPVKSCLSEGGKTPFVVH